MSDCIVAIKSALKTGDLNDTQAKELIQRMENLALARRAEKGLKMDEALKEIAGEMKAGADAMRLIDRRNRLLSLAAFKSKLTEITNNADWGKKAYKQKIEMLYAQMRGMEKTYKAPLAAFLKENDLMDIARKGQYGKEMYAEMYNVESGGTTPVTSVQGDKLFKFAKFYKELRDQHVAEKRLHGAYIADPNKPYGFLQSWSTDKIRALGGKTLDEGHKDRARQAWFNMVADWDIHPDTYAGRDGSKFWHEVFDNLYQGTHEVLPDKVDIDEFKGVHGSTANRLSESRLIWFANADSQYRAMQAVGSGHYFELMMREMDTSARGVVAMREWGPNWKNTQAIVSSTLEALARDRPDSAKQQDSLKAFHLDAYQRIINGEADQSRRPNLSTWVRNLIAWTHTAKMGASTIASFNDLPMINNQLAMQGLSAADRMMFQLRGFKPDSKGQKQVLNGLNVVSHSMIGSIQNRYGVSGLNGVTARVAHAANELNLFNQWNDMNQNVLAQASSWFLGEHSNLAHDAVPPPLREKLNKFGIGPKEWDAIRSVATKIPDGGPDADAKFVLLDQLPKIEDAKLDPIIAQRGQSLTTANRNRARTDLQIRLSTLFSDEVDSALSNPTLTTKYAMTGGGIQAGTYPRELLNLLMIFKGFPITTALRFKERARENGVSNLFSVSQWARNPGFAWQQSKLVAASFVAGYIAMTTKDLLAGRTPRQLIDEDGKPNPTTFLAAAAKGNALGIWGDLLFSEYDRQYKSLLTSAAGPVIGQVDSLAALYTNLRDNAAQGEVKATAGSQAFNAITSNMPFSNLFYVKPILNAFIFWNIREALSPGVLQREELTAHNQNHQNFFISPTDVGTIPITEPGRKLETILNR